MMKSQIQKTSNYIYPKKVNKPPNYDNQFGIVTKNRFSGLTNDDGKDVDKSITIIKENKKRKRNDRRNKDKRINNKHMNPEKQQQKRTITMLGDSIIKGIKITRLKNTRNRRKYICKVFSLCKNFLV